METKFGPEETIKASELRSGDFLVLVPTQKFGKIMMRGMRFEGLVEIDETHPDFDPNYGHFAPIPRALGDHGYFIPIRTRKSAWYKIPSFFDLVVRREVAA
jgi:hypothetical protein